jgi:Lrp/AsnC family transcriptional regulator, leucine-responsive regulatory protein
MRETGVITAEVACVAPDAVGHPLTCLVTVDLEREKAADLERFRQGILAHARVQQCYYVTGQSDFFLVVLARDMADYEDFTRRVFLADGNVKSFTTHVVLERVRVGMTTPIGPST